MFSIFREISRGAVIAVAVVLAVITVAIVAAFATGVFSDVTAERRGQTGQQEQTVGDGTYRIAQYDQFFDRCQTIVAVQGDVDATKQSLDSGSDPTQRFYDEQNLRAQQANLRQLVAQYNADAAKTATAGQFRDSNLPARIDQNGTTTCTAG